MHVVCGRYDFTRLFSPCLFIFQKRKKKINFLCCVFRARAVFDDATFKSCYSQELFFYNGTSQTDVLEDVSGCIAELEWNV